jgi:demethoxyubiquinone hydroxylase (CLK1/Coq7/Cat5 family)
MKKTNKEKVKEFIRVDHAGERGAIKIFISLIITTITIKLFLTYEKNK